MVSDSPAQVSKPLHIGTTTCLLEDSLLLQCGAPNALVISVDQNGVPGQGDSSNPATNGQSFAFTSQATLIPSISGQQVYTSSSCLFGTVGCTSNVKLVSGDANGKPLGGDFAAMEASGTFMTFATLGSASSPGTSEVFLADPFF